jgi:hypothetical protein
MSEEDYSKDESRKRERVILFRVNEFFQHKFILSIWGAHRRHIRSVLRPNYRSIGIAGMMPNQPGVFARFLTSLSDKALRCRLT